MSELQVFQNAEFGSVRTAAINGEPFFVGKDVAEILGYSNTRKALTDHVDDEDKLDGVTIYMTHGHLQGVKLFRDKLILEGLGCGADVILYGHTHEPDCRRLPEGCWLMNPGSVGCGGTAGMIVTKAGAAECRIIRQRDLEEI